MSSKLFDIRCPACDLPAKGKQEVLNNRPVKLPVACQHCNTKVKLLPGSDSDLSDGLDIA